MSSSRCRTSRRTARTASRGYPGAHARKLAFAQSVVGLGLALTVNTVIHRANIGRVAALVETAASLGAGRVEIAHTQYYGWALRNRHALMPTREQVDRAMQEMEAIRPRYHGRLVIDLVVPDYYARRPKACMGGWARRSLNVTPSGRVLPCHAAETIPGLRSGRCAIIRWQRSGASRRRFRHSAAPTGCRSLAAPATCARSTSAAAAARRWRSTGDAAATDPACELSPHHARMQALAGQDSAEATEDYAYRGRAARGRATAIPAH